MAQGVVSGCDIRLSENCLAPGRRAWPVFLGPSCLWLHGTEAEVRQFSADVIAALEEALAEYRRAKAKSVAEQPAPIPEVPAAVPDYTTGQDAPTAF